MAKTHYCFLERFNNYFNRKLIRRESLEDYQDASESFYIPSDSDGKALPFDFNPNDNITTEIIANDVPFDPDYFLLLDEDLEIVSRWFVLEQKRNRKGQWLYFLRRDVLADSFNDLRDAPIYVERGIINDIDSPLLLNNEDLRVNQIKKREILLKDKSNCAWLVLYLKKGVLGNTSIGSSGKFALNVSDDSTFVYETLSTPITAWQYYGNITTPYKVAKKHTFVVDYNQVFYSYGYMVNSLQESSVSSYSSFNYNTNLSTDKSTSFVLTNLNGQFISNMSTLISTTNSAYGYNSTDGLSAYDGKIIKDSQGKYFKVTLSYSTSTVKEDVTTVQFSLKTLMTNYWNTALSQSASPNNKAFSVTSEITSITVSLEEMKDLQTEADLGAYSGNGTADSSLFDAICLPYGNLEMFIGTEVSIDTQATAEKSLKIMNSLATALTSEYVLDLQLLPYCPCQNLINEDYGAEGGIFVPEDYAGETIKCVHSGDVTDFLLVCHSANFTLDIAQKVNISISNNVPQPYKIKYINDCTLVRLCSPNYNGLFDMNLAKNGGEITSFNVDITLRPFNPYIHVNPDFSFLYGQDFNDIRGLICGGDFSLGIINDAWNVYEIQNKNYQAIFDRQIQNLDVNNAINLQEATWGAIAGTIQGTASGAIAGGMMGGGYGAVAGAVVGGVVSGAGGVLDVANIQKRQEEARNYALDNYNLQLGNIRALPNSITKTSALTYNNKLFPFVEIYECSEVEKEAYFEKLRYNGMSVRIIDKIRSYISDDNSQYFRGRLIRLTTVSEDNHYVETINEELMKGVYI
ncbi:MAG: hypothetical protein J6V44_01710 [Methanobrevibacter sp.]|nr:hypothetical protein [Methanobrevibacter sp.]